MLTSVLIAKKRDHMALSREEIAWLIQGYASGEIPDYQMSAFAMAVYLNGMDREETEALTMSMLRSGEVLSGSSGCPRVDKHSTGGLGDKTSLILAPLLALYDLHVPMISGRGLGITGGTLDKMEAIPGYRTNLSEQEIATQLRAVGCVITGASEKLVPADRKLYALRDVTATVPSIPLITASIMSKKLAESLDALVLDVKWGSGAFMQEREQAIALAKSLKSIGNGVGLNTQAILSDMNQPLGRMIGNACEVNESIELMQGNGPDDCRELTVELAAVLLVQAQREPSMAAARASIEEKLQSGAVLERFFHMVEAQGGTLGGLLPLAKAFAWQIPRSGCISKMNGQLIGQAVIELGGGRRIASDRVDPRVGLDCRIRIGDRVQAGDPGFYLFANTPEAADRCRQTLNQAIMIEDEAVQPLPLFEVLA